MVYISTLVWRQEMEPIFVGFAAELEQENLVEINLEELLKSQTTPSSGTLEVKQEVLNANP